MRKSQFNLIFTLHPGLGREGLKSLFLFRSNTIKYDDYIIISKIQILIYKGINIVNTKANR